jgi:hypothetical protein
MCQCQGLEVLHGPNQFVCPWLFEALTAIFIRQHDVESLECDALIMRDEFSEKRIGVRVEVGFNELSELVPWR